MNETQLLFIAASLVSVMFGLLCTILGWTGSRMSTKIDALSERISSMAAELHEKVNGIDRRVTRIETRCDVTHNGHMESRG